MLLTLIRRFSRPYITAVIGFPLASTIAAVHG